MENRTVTIPEPDLTEAAKLGTILAAVRPRTYMPTGDIADRMTRRLVAALTTDPSTDAPGLLTLLQLDTEDERPLISLWADELTAPYLGLTEHHRDGSATMWRLRPAAAGIVFHDGAYHYWPDPALDTDIPNMPITLGVDDWCLNY